MREAWVIKPYLMSFSAAGATVAERAAYVTAAAAQAQGMLPGWGQQQLETTGFPPGVYLDDQNNLLLITSNVTEVVHIHAP
jgi:hypothetical protein